MKLGRLLIGLVSGLTFGMLFAPGKGEDLRKQVLKKSKKSGTEGLKVLAEALLEAGGEAYAEFQRLSKTEQVQALKTLSQEKLEGLLAKAEDHGYDVAGKFQEKMEKVAVFLSENKGVLQKAKKMVLSKKKAAPKAKKTKKANK